MKESLKRMAVLSLMVFVICASAPAVVFAEEKPIEFSVNLGFPEQSWIAQKDTTPFYRQIENSCHDRVKINLFYGSTLSSPLDAYDSAVDGIADIAWGIHGLMPGRFPMMSLFTILEIGQSMMAAQHVMYDLYQKFPEIEAEHKGVKIIFISGIKELAYFLQKPVRKLEDFKGLRLRAPGAAGEMFKEWGAAPIAIPGNEMYMALQKKIIDGAGTDIGVVFAFKLHELTDYALLGPFPSATNFMVMNRKKWDSLPPEIQKVFLYAGAKSWLEGGAPADEFAHQVLQKYKGMPGKEVIILSAEDREKWFAAARPFHEKWIADMEAKGLPGREVFDEAVMLTKKYNAMYPAPWIEN